MGRVTSLTALAAFLFSFVCLAMPAQAVTSDDGRGTDYVVNKSDNITGLDAPRQLSRPSKVDYDKLLNATAEMKRLRKDKIDRNSPEGIRLCTNAADRVKKACEKVRTDKAYCSVWKKIKRRDGKAISDITSSVQKEITGKA
jgi:hypothetical protein